MTSYSGTQLAWAGGFASEGPGAAAEVQKDWRRTEAWLIAPVPEAVLGGLVTLDVEFTEETAEHRPASTSTRQALKTGVIWHPHHKEGAPRYYLAAARTGLADGTKSVRPVASWTVGSRIGEDDLPIRLAFSPTDVTMTHLFVTGHKFPEYYRITGGLGHRLRTKNGLIFDLRLPDRAVIGFAASNDRWRIFGGWEKEQEFFPHVGETRGWSEEFREKRMIGGRLRIKGALYAALTGGDLRTISEIYNYKGERLDDKRSTFSPFLRLALESWISVL